MNLVNLRRACALSMISLMFVSTLLTPFKTQAQATPPPTSNKPYKLDVIAVNGQNGLTGVYPSPSINDNGVVAFGGRLTGGAIFVSDAPGTYRKILSGTNTSHFTGGNVQINNLNQVASWLSIPSVSPPQSYLRRLNGNAMDAITITAAAGGTGGFNEFDQVYASATINDNNQSAFNQRIGNTTTTLTTGERPTFYQRQYASTGDTLRPMISEDGCVVVRAGGTASDPIRLYEYDLSASEEIANTSMGFTALGQSPSISEHCEVITFYGDLNATGAQAIGTTPGAGIFASLALADGTRRIVRLAGRQVEDIAATGGNDDGVCDTGESCKQGELGFDGAGNPLFFSSFNANSRVAVAHQSLGAEGLQEDSFIVSFLATPNAASGDTLFSASLGL